MALISSGGGTLTRFPKPKPAGRAHGGGGGFGPARSQPPKLKPIVKTGPYQVAPGPGGSTTGSTNDPFAFVQGLMQIQDPDKIRALIDPIYAPLRQQVNDQIAQLGAMSTARANQMKDVYAAFAQYLTGLPNQIQSIYKQQGFQDGMALAGGMAGPQGAVGSHLATMGGIDQNLNDQLGKNWAAYAAAQPGIYSLRATQNIKQMLGDANASEFKLREDLLSLSSKEAESILQYLENAQSKDAELQMWAYGQKESLAAAGAKSEQDYLNYLQRQRQIDFNNNIVQGKLTLAQAKAQADASYKASLLQLRQAGLISQDAYRQALVGLGQARLQVEQQNANTNAGRLALSQKTAAQQAATKRTGGVQKAQANIAKIRSGAAAYATSLRQSTTGSTSTSVGTSKSGRVSQSTSTPRYSKPQIYNLVYRRYAAQLFDYYRTVYPNVKNYQAFVDRAIRNAVGYGPSG